MWKERGRESERDAARGTERKRRCERDVERGTEKHMKAKEKERLGEHTTVEREMNLGLRHT